MHLHISEGLKQMEYVSAYISYFEETLGCICNLHTSRDIFLTDFHRMSCYSSNSYAFVKVPENKSVPGIFRFISEDMMI